MEFHILIGILILVIIIILFVKALKLIFRIAIIVIIVILALLFTSLLLKTPLQDMNSFMNSPEKYILVENDEGFNIEGIKLSCIYINLSENEKQLDKEEVKNVYQWFQTNNIPKDTVILYVKKDVNLSNKRDIIKAMLTKDIIIKTSKR